MAKEYSVETVLRASGEHDDNVRLAEDKISIAGVVVSPQVNLRLRTERLDVALHTKLDFARFNKSEYNSDDQDVSLMSSYAFEYDVFKANARVKRDSTRTSEIEPFGSGEIGNRAVRREADNANLAWQHLFSEKKSLELSANYADVKYDSTNPNISNYEYVGANVAYGVALSDRTRVIVQAAINRFDSDALRVMEFGVSGLTLAANFFPTKIQSDSFGLNVGVERVLSEKLLYSVAVGATYVETSFDSSSAQSAANQSDLDLLSGLDDEDDTSFFLSSSLRYAGERTTLDVSVSASTNPSSNGYLLLSNQLVLSADYRVTERSNVFTSINFIDSEPLGDATRQSRDASERTYSAARVGVSYRLTEALYAELAYRYRVQDREDFGDNTKSNAAFLEVVYKPHRKTWSR